MEFYAVIMAGGSGTRFWPLSRKKNPKQFLPIISEKTMIEETVQRLTPLIPESQITTISNADQARKIKELLPRLPEKNVLVEPLGKNTAPSLLLANAVIYLKNPSAVVAALPADHLITDAALFLKKLEAGARVAAQSSDLITFGIPPSFPATGYGYIQFSTEAPQIMDGEHFYSVQEFKEKPDIKQARQFILEGNCYWNSGMFLWKIEAFVQQLKHRSPAMYDYWIKICDFLERGAESGIRDIFEEIPAISIDYALMEKADAVRMCTGNFGWSDVGSWTALGEIWQRDSRGNACRGENILIDATNCQVYNPDKMTALVGVQDMIIINSDDALLICRKDQDQRVKEIVEILKKKNKGEFL
jgi:mannose-1-phosphate guanylyltransferase